jgi:ClpP class serine protease
LFSSNEKFSDRQKRMIRNWMQTTYEQFTSRVMTTRRGKIDDIDKVARGRIFLAQQAKELGMVDELGGLSEAVAHAADLAGLPKNGYDVHTIPPPRSLADLLFGTSGDSNEDARNPFSPNTASKADAILQLLPTSARKIVAHQIRMAQLMERRPVVLITPFVMTVR